eukprot:TRINITY_DN395_c0_g1_i2.p4 TRINITY_DN395_c0_g1~~TRINITY_DN395_c0_g1_i2.p4  ORF type:complete len:100 (+),score=19.14 TRINITY_DN395_c0_g1_i2:1582-1881(+)
MALEEQRLVSSTDLVSILNIHNCHQPSSVFSCSALSPASSPSPSPLSPSGSSSPSLISTVAALSSIALAILLASFTSSGIDGSPSWLLRGMQLLEPLLQ